MTRGGEDPLVIMPEVRGPNKKIKNKWQQCWHSSCSCKQGEARKCEQTAPKTQIRGLCLPAGGSEVWQMSPVHPSPLPFIPSLSSSLSFFPLSLLLSQLCPGYSHLQGKHLLRCQNRDRHFFNHNNIHSGYLFVCYAQILNKEVCVLIAKEKVVSWLGQVRQRHRRIWR